MRGAAVAMAALWLLARAAPAWPGVRVVEDEVVFMLRAPDAAEVYLVGDFNNWNPTVEKMEGEDGTFTVSLFLVAGTYRYKFVVDGVWRADPDNPARTDRGSVFTLEERAGGYALSTDEPEPERPIAAVTPRLRYIGLFNRTGDEHDNGQIADLYLDASRPGLRAGVDLQSVDDTWRWSPPTADVDVLRARVEVRTGAWTVTGFENDTTWTSRGPVTVVGRDGVFDYDAGYDRHGVAAVLAPSSFFLLRGLYADHATAPALAPGRIDAATVAAVTRDTTVYAPGGGTRDADQAAVELVIDTGDLDLGYVRRIDRGLHAGVRAAFEPSGAALPVTLEATRESRDVTLYWARLRSVFGFGVDAGYGHGSSNIDVERRARLDADPASGLDAGAATGDADARLPLLESDRVVVGADRRAIGIQWRAWWDYVSLDVDRSLAPNASSEVHRAGAGGAFARGSWRARLDVRYSDQRYRGAPADVLVDSPARNVWLYGRDEFTLADLVELDTDRYSDAALDASWTAPDSTSLLSLVRARVAIAGDGVFGGLSLVEATARTELRAPAGAAAGAYAALAGRLAAYDRAAWGTTTTFASGWVGAGYRRGAVDVSVGYGYDPVVFDPVANEFRDIGWLLWVRRAADGGVRRGDAAATGARVVALERELEAYHTVKLQCVVRF